MAKWGLYKTVVRDLEKTGWNFRINDLDESLEYQHHGGTWELTHDTIDAIINVDMRELGYGTRKKPSLSAMKECVTKYAHENRYNPIKDYLISLDGKYQPQTTGPYYIPMLADHIKSPDSQEGIFEKWLFRWMVGSIAKIMDGQRNPMLVLVSGQKVGKSTLARWLCPITGKFKQGAIKPDNKDHIIALTNNFIWEVEELGATTRRSDAESMKSFITLPEIIERLPYGKKPVRKSVMTNFIGTVNFDGAGFLVDITGNTRFLCVEIDGINFEYTENLNVDDLWAEAYWYYKNVPDSWELTADEEKLQAEINKNYEVISALEDVIDMCYIITGNEDDFLTTQFIKQDIKTEYGGASPNALQNELGRVLNKLGCRRGRQPHSQGGLRGWTGIKIKPKIELTAEPQKAQTEPKEDETSF